MTTTPVRSLPFSVLAKPTGAACNLDCTYCFYLSKEMLYDHDGQRMPEDGLETYLTRLFAAQPPGPGPVEVAWQGGEPTLRGLPFFRRAVEIATRLARPGQQVQHALQTNGTLLNDEWGAFLAENNFLVGLSVDGPADLHDAYRVNKAGRGSHAQVIRGWEILRRHQVETNILCTLHAANTGDPLRVYRYFRDELKTQFVQFIPIVERAHSPGAMYTQQGDQVTGRSVNPVAYGDFLIAVFDEWLTHDVGEMFVQDFDVLLGNYFGRYSLCVHSPECGFALAVEHNGDVYSCDHYVEPAYRLGNVERTPIQAMLQSPEQRRFGRAKSTELPTQCQTCDVRWACHGGCPKDRFTGADGKLNYLCPGYHRFYAHARPAIERMAGLLRSGRPAADIMAV